MNCLGHFFLLLILCFATTAQGGCVFQESSFNSCVNNCKIEDSQAFCDSLKCNTYCYAQQGCSDGYQLHCLAAKVLDASCNVECNPGDRRIPASLGLMLAGAWLVARIARG